MKYVLVGNPNVGKTTTFNSLTDSIDKVGNFHGTTVKATTRQSKDGKNELVDLPGIRSLVHDSADEAVSFKYLYESEYDKIINVLDGTNLRRNLYLSIQLLEMGCPINFMINMCDEMEKMNIKIDLDQFRKCFSNVELVSMQSEKDVDKIFKFISESSKVNFKINYGDTIEKAIAEIIEILTPHKLKCNYRFVAIQLLCKNNAMFEYLDKAVVKKINLVLEKTLEIILDKGLSKSISGLIFAKRRQYIDTSLSLIVTSKKQKDIPQGKDLLMNRYFGIPIFIIIFYLMWLITFKIGDPIADFIDSNVISVISNLTFEFLSSINTPEWIVSLVVDGVLAGAGSVITFLPHIIIVFLLLSILEGSGYMSRSIVLFDFVLSKVGLNGKALAPMMIGFGCNVPAVMATRTIANKKERLITQLIIPFMSCSARTPIYLMFISIFFESHQATIMVFLNFLGVFVAIASAKLFSLTFFKSNEPFFIVELPPYRKINVEYIYKIVVNKVKQFVNNAGRFIVLGSIAIWFLLHFGFQGYTSEMTSSFYAYIGYTFDILFAPLGFGTWQATSSLISGFMAKELVVAQFEVMYMDYQSTSIGIVDTFTWQSSISFMIFNLLYIPCLSTLAVIKSETNSNKWMFFSVFYSLTVAYIISLLFYQGVMLFY